MEDHRPNRQTVRDALKMVLRPLMGLALARGLDLPALVGLLKEVLVEVAAGRSENGKPATMSRISLLTGVHRKDVRAILEREDRAEAERATAPGAISRIETVLGRWAGDPAYRAPDGSPRVLSRQAGPEGPGFDDLVASVSTDIRPRTVLDTLQELGLVTVEGDRLRLAAPGFVPRADEAAMLGFLGRNLADHAAAAGANVLAERDPPFLERAVYYDGLGPAAVDAIEAAARAAAERALLDLNAQALAAQSETKEPGRERFRFGVYFYRAEDTETDKGDGV